MATFRTRSMLLGGILALVGVLGACDYLRDTEPFTVTITYEDGPDGTLVVTPLEFEADAAFGEIQIVNDSQRKHGFAIPDLLVFVEIEPKRQQTARVNEAKDGKTYAYFDHLDGHENEYRGRMTVHYLAEEER